jgi:diguanylate cyclase (GGDEF)-like protein
MPIVPDRSRRRVPTRALILSIAALAVPVAGAFLFPEGLAEYAVLLWLIALVPAFLLAYYRGWWGAATALAGGMATLSLTSAAVTWMGQPVPDLLLGVVIAYVAIALGIGGLAERLHQDRDEVEDMAFTDILTHLPNRRHARVFLENEFAAAERGRLLSVALFDLDSFKAFNDRHGHQAGDEALKAFAEVLTRSTRRMNLAARFGGEEFLAILAGSDSEGAMVFADRVRTSLQSRSIGGEALTVSGGVAVYHPSMRSPDELLAAADHALYQAKREGRNCVRLFGNAGLERVQARVTEPPPERVVPEYPRAPEEIGKSPPSTTLLPGQVTAFAVGRRALLVEDEVQVRSVISNYLGREGFSVEEAGSVAEGIKWLREEFDAVVTDIRLPGASGNELVSAVKARWPATQVIVITGLQDAQVAAEALNAGADRYLFKPFGMPELRAHLVDALSRRDRILADRSEKHMLTTEARARAEQAREAVLKGARALVRAVEVRDPYTRGHSDRVARYAQVLSAAHQGTRELIDPDLLKLACELHDVGKIGVSDAILNKEGRLTTEEFTQVRKHPRTGRRILEPLLDDPVVLAVVSWHHERWDGAGYPDALAGDTIPIAARIVAVADALDAMTSERAYRSALSWEEALKQMRDLAGSQFDPGVVELAGRCEKELREIFEEQVRSAV